MPGTAADGHFARERMRRGVGAEEIAGVARSRRLAQRRAIARGLDHRHGVHHRLDAGAEPIGAGEIEMIGRDRAADLRRRALDELGALFRRQMLERHAQTGKFFDPFRQTPLDEHRFAVENIDVGTDLLAVHEERHADLFHAVEDARDVAIVGDAGRRIGRGVGRIELDRRRRRRRESRARRRPDRSRR